MKLKTQLAVVPTLALLFGATACKDGLTDVNKNPNQSVTAPAGNILAGAIRDMAARNQYGAFGYWSQLYNTELWVQHVAQSQYNDEDRYRPRTGVSESIWSSLYSSLLDFKRVRELALQERDRTPAEEANDQDLWAVSEIMSVYTWQVLTDMFGDVPYTEALQLDEGIQNPKYDSQEAIYTDLLARLDAATSKIDPDADVDFAYGDLIYHGDMQRWLEFGNSLRLRIAMRMSNTEKANEAKAAFQAAWNADKFDEVDDGAALVWNTTSVAPIYEDLVKGGRTGDFRVSQTVVDTLAHRNDPRLAIYANPAVSDGEYRGLPNGKLPSSLSKTSKDFSTIGDAFVEADAPSVLMSYSEVLFLGAEAAARGWIAADPAQLYRQGITASMKQYGISDAEIATYLAQPVVAYNGLESIGLQKWIALYLSGPEAFADYRRTGIPNLQPSANALQDMIPTRLPYPSNESLYNPENFKSYVDVYIDDPLWWAKQ